MAKNKHKKVKKSKRRKEYEAYLNSPKWINFRNKIKFARGNKCELCPKTGGNLHGHHLTYERFGNELESDIQILCKKCHFEIHDKEKGRVKPKSVNGIIRMPEKEEKLYAYSPRKIKKEKPKKVNKLKWRPKKKKPCKVKSAVFEMSLKEREAMRELNRQKFLESKNNQTL